MVRTPTPRPVCRAGLARYREQWARLERTNLAPPVRRPPGLVPSAAPEGFAKCKFSAPARGFKIGRQPNFAKPAHLAQARRRCWLGAGRRGRSAAGRSGGARWVCSVLQPYERKTKSPRLYRWGLFVNFALPHARKYRGRRYTGAIAPLGVSVRSPLANPG